MTRFNVPPGWPPPAPGWFPDRAWAPDPAWPPAPPGWQFFVDEPAAAVRQPSVVGGWLARFAALPKPLSIGVVAVLVVSLLTLGFNRAMQPEVIVLKPVDQRGNIVYDEIDWDLRTPSIEVDCSGGWPSPFDVSGHARSCGSNADATFACFPDEDAALIACVQDPFAEELAYISATGLDEPRQPLKEDPRPLGLELSDGAQCQARTGGAWGSPTQHPDWIGYYGCRYPDDEDAFAAVWGPGDRDNGIDKGIGGWKVSVGSGEGKLKTERVTKVIYVGTT